MTDHVVTGRAWRFGDDIDTDVIIPSQYMRLEPEEYAPHTMEPLDPEFASRVEPGDIIVAERNFGIGSSREHAAIALTVLGVGAVLAASFARIFRRNAINEGLPALTIDETVVERISNGDEIRVNLESGTIENLSEGWTERFDPLNEPVKSILAAGGAVEYFTGDENR